MSTNAWFQIILYLGVLVVLALPLGLFMARVFEGRPGRLERILGPVERLVYRLCGVRADEEMNWKQYAVAMLIFNLFGCLLVYALQRVQVFLPLNPQKLDAVAPDSAFNTAVSFATNTNWQDYGGESTMTYLTQMLALTVQNFVSAATGIAVLVALIRGIVRKETDRIGNFWTDLTRSTLYILAPLSIVLALALVWQGVPQTFGPAPTVPLLQPTQDDKGNAVTEQALSVGLVASQVAIKQLGTNGGGFFNTNSAHPFENPTPLSNFMELLAILLIPAALCFAFGKMVKDMRQGFAILAAMLALFLVCVIGCVWVEERGNPILTRLGVDQTPHDAGSVLLAVPSSSMQSGGNMEGKEVRFGPVNSAIWATATTAASNGSVNSMHDSFTPLGGLVPMWLIKLGEVIFGGVGSGLYGMLAFVIVTVFVAGLMVGRTPEYLGKKIEAKEMKMASLVILIVPLLVLVGSAAAAISDAGTSSLTNHGPHGLSEILYAYASTSNNNGSAFAGLNANTTYYNLTTGLAMLLGRYWLAVPILAIAGSLARKKIVPAGAGTLPTHTPLFVAMLAGVVALVGALSFIPALALGPIAEFLQMIRP
jgi:potassium-transporting ATPase potassium-binding subunit